MSIRDKLSNTKLDDSPIWLSNASETTKELYQSALYEFTRIQALINSGESIPIKDRKINQSAVARAVERDKSILSGRRQPELMQWISQKNNELSNLLANNHRRKNKVKSKTDLKSEISRLRQVNKDAVIDGLRSFVETILSSNILDDHDRLARENIRLNLKNDALNKQIINLQDLCHRQAVQLAKLKNKQSNYKTNLTLISDSKGHD